MTPEQPIDTRALFRPLHASLMTLLRGLEPDDWDTPAVARAWSLRDVAAHLLDVDLRRISVDRDHHRPPGPAAGVEEYDDLLRYLNQLNAEWIAAARRISPRLLTDLLNATGLTVSSLMEGSRLSGEAVFPVAWAGQSRSPTWLDTGREYTERWHHQDQIREAVGAAPVSARELLSPVIAISLYAIPPALARLDSPAGTSIELRATGAAGSVWHIDRAADGWRITEGEAAAPTARIALSDIALARLLLHRIGAAELTGLVTVEGDSALAGALLAARAVMV